MIIKLSYSLLVLRLESNRVSLSRRRADWERCSVILAWAHLLDSYFLQTDQVTFEVKLIHLLRLKALVLLFQVYLVPHQLCGLLYVSQKHLYH